MKKGFLTKALVAVGVMVSALALSSVCAFAETIHSLTYTDAGTIVKTTDSSTPTTSTVDGFTIYNYSTSTDLAIDGSEKSITSANGVDHSYTHRIKLSKDGNSFKISFHASAGSVLIVDGMSSKAGSTRPLVISKGDTTNTVMTNDGNSLGTTAYYIAEEGDYFLASAKGSDNKNGFNIFGLYLIDGAVSTTDANSSTPAAFSDGNKIYALAAVSDTSSYSSVTIGDQTSNSVYESVSIDNMTIPASAFGSDYVYAVQVTDATKNSDVTAKTNAVILAE